MPVKNRLCGLMAGIAAGFAVWGALPADPAAGVQKPVVQTAAFAAASPSAQAAESALSAKLHAAGAVLMDGDSGRILFSKNGEKFCPVASTTKLMTCILALEEAEPGAVCVFSQKAAAQPKVRLGARAGSEFYLKDLLYSLMLESHNDTAVAVAEAVAGSVPEFAERMNRRAGELGCTSTCFLTPNGLDAQETLEDGSVRTNGSTAADLARILRYCVMLSPAREKFLEITQTSDYSFTDRSGKNRYFCRNHNALLSQLPGVISGKTGFTGKAGYCYAGALRSEGRTFVLTLLGCGWPPHKTWKWEDARTLFAYGERHYRYREPAQENLLRRVPVLKGEEPYVLAVRAPGKNQKRRLLLSDEEEAAVSARLPAALLAPVKKGQRIGSLVYAVNGRELYTEALNADRGVKRRTPYQAFADVLRKILGRISFFL